MKSTYRILVALLLLVIYSFAITHFAKSILDYGIENEKNTKNQAYLNSLKDNSLTYSLSYSLAHSSNYSLSDSPQTLSSVNEVTTFSVVTLKSVINQFWIVRKAKEQLIESEFSQYARFSTNFLILYRKKDIIFPSHYFW